jgi:hypothetical protein
MALAVMALAVMALAVMAALAFVQAHHGCCRCRALHIAISRDCTGVQCKRDISCQRCSAQHAWGHRLVRRHILGCKDSST